MGAANAVYGQPIQNLNQLTTPAMGLGGMGGTTQGVGTATGTQTPANDPMANILGGLAGGAGILGSLGTAGGSAGIAGLFSGSDRRAKTDIKDIGRTHDNQKIYSYRFKGSNMHDGSGAECYSPWTTGVCGIAGGWTIAIEPGLRGSANDATAANFLLGG
jgi:hypothetical protein